MTIWVKIVIVLIILHLIVGFGWLAFKLAPRKKPKSDSNQKEK